MFANAHTIAVVTLMPVGNFFLHNCLCSVLSLLVYYSLHYEFALEFLKEI